MQESAAEKTRFFPPQAKIQARNLLMRKRGMSVFSLLPAQKMLKYPIMKNLR